MPPVPWWQRIIDPEALRALIIIAALLVWFYLRRQRFAVSVTLHPRWHGFAWSRTEGPWPLHARVGLFSMNVYREVP